MLDKNTNNIILFFKILFFWRKLFFFLVKMLFLGNSEIEEIVSYGPVYVTNDGITQDTVSQINFGKISQKLKIY